MISSGRPHVHAPHGGVSSWRDFFVHIAIITIGLLLALGLEQIVQSIHHANQRAELEEQMRETFVANARIDQKNLQVLGDMRDYFVGLHTAVAARRNGQIASLPIPPRYNYTTLTSLGPFEAARANGTITVMNLDRIRLYNRIEYQHGLVSDEFADMRHSIRALRAFRKRFDTAPVADNLQFTVLPPDLAALSGPELDEYRKLIADALEITDQLVVRIRRIENQTTALLNGARNESDLIKATVDVQGEAAPEPSGDAK